MLFRQTRVGRDGKAFLCLKFRTMVLDAETSCRTWLPARPSDMLFKMRLDPRVTKVGRWLRRYSVDELPQLVNVLRGDMSLVGPRPPLPTEVARYESRRRPPARRTTGAHRALADLRQVQPLVGGHRPPRHLLRRQLVDGPGRRDPAEDGLGACLAARGAY